ncbi:MAG: dTDP-4-dehydrorhamnose 3,5-epimerase [Lewinellaceae bacterium]|nr:dTDP-4-dehydrorhamnose 3,5-epimerase [Lewinellaceae bacterium]
MRFEKQPLEGLAVIRFDPFTDHRGAFARTYDGKVFEQQGIPVEWVQENQSVSLTKGTVRGLHFLLPPHTDGKLVRCIQGAVFDVAVDLRAGSRTQGQWMSFLLRAGDDSMLYIPKGFAHGFCTLSDHSLILYKHDSYYDKASDSGILWNDPALAIEWPEEDPIISEKDKGLMTYQEFIKKYNGL